MTDQLDDRVVEQLRTLNKHVAAYLEILKCSGSTRAAQVATDLEASKKLLLNLGMEAAAKKHKSRADGKPAPEKPEAKPVTLDSALDDLSGMLGAAAPLVEMLARLARGGKP